MCLLFIGLERDKFDNKTVSFEEHIKSEHNMWHYLYFIVLVRVKDPTEYTGPESYVAQMITVSQDRSELVWWEVALSDMASLYSPLIVGSLCLHSYKDIIIHFPKNVAKAQYRT